MLCLVFEKWFSSCFQWAHLEKTGIGQYLTSSPNTWRKFLLKPRLKPFLSVPWRNTGERTASVTADEEQRKRIRNTALPPQPLHNLLILNWSSIKQRIIAGAAQAELWHRENNSESKCLCCAGKTRSQAVSPGVTSPSEHRISVSY